MMYVPVNGMAMLWKQSGKEDPDSIVLKPLNGYHIGEPHVLMPESCSDNGTST